MIKNSVTVFLQSDDVPWWAILAITMLNFKLFFFFLHTFKFTFAYTVTLPVKSFCTKRFVMFLKNSLLLTKPALFWSKMQQNWEIFLLLNNCCLFEYIKKINSQILQFSKLNFSIITRHMILQKSFWFSGQKTWLLLWCWKQLSRICLGFFDE